MINWRYWQIQAIRFLHQKSKYPYEFKSNKNI